LGGRNILTYTKDNKQMPVNFGKGGVFDYIKEAIKGTLSAIFSSKKSLNFD